MVRKVEMRAEEVREITSTRLLGDIAYRVRLVTTYEEYSHWDWTRLRENFGWVWVPREIRRIYLGRTTVWCSPIDGECCGEHEARMMGLSEQSADHLRYSATDIIMKALYVQLALPQVALEDCT